MMSHTHMIPNQIPKNYLGDSVYAEVDGIGDLVLTTDNGLGPTNVIVLEPQVVGALIRLLERAYPIEVFVRKEPDASSS